MIWLALATLAIGYLLGRARPLHRASDWANWQKYGKPTAIHDAATAAIRVLGTDRCTHHSDTHRTHHTSPVTGCPWCTSPADQTPAATTINPGSHL